MDIQIQPTLTIATLALLILRNDNKDGDLCYLRGSTADDDGLQGFYRFDVSSTVTADSDKTVQTTDDAGVDITVGRWIRIGASAALPVVTQPTTGSIVMEHRPGASGHMTTKFTLTLAEMPCTDAGGSGSYGTLPLCAIPNGHVIFRGCRQDYTAFGEDLLLTANQGDAVFDIGIGSVAIASAADGALAGTDDDIGLEVGQLTMSSGTGSGSNTGAEKVNFDGTSTAASINLNWSGTGATIEANGKMFVTATITIDWTFLDDD